MKLPNDICRCMGSGCPVSLRETCQRYIQREPAKDTVGHVSCVAVLNLVRCSNQCDFLIKEKA